jgi:hypothetical protein
VQLLYANSAKDKREVQLFCDAFTKILGIVQVFDLPVQSDHLIVGDEKTIDSAGCSNGLKDISRIC